MVTIRLTRRGARNQPFYHLVVTDSRKRQGGKSLEQWYIPGQGTGAPGDLPKTAPKCLWADVAALLRDAAGSATRARRRAADAERIIKRVASSARA